MKISLLFGSILLLILGACRLDSQTGSSGEGEQSARLPWKLICLGDGITAGVGLRPEQAYPQQLADLFAADSLRVKIVNAGIKGETVASANERIEWLLQQRFSAMLLAIGCEDQRRAIAPDRVLASWQELLQKVRYAYPAIPIFVVAPCARAGVLTEEAFYGSLQEEFQTIFVPLRLESVEYWAADNNYLTEKGQDELAQQLYHALATYPKE